MKFDVHCRVFSITFTKLLKDYYKNNGGLALVKPYIKDIKKEYKAMIKRTPGLSKDNQMADNLKGAAYYFAIAKIIPNMTPELLDKIIAYEFDSPFMHKLYDGQKKKGTLFSDKAQDKMYQDSLRSQKSNDEMDWKFEYHKGVDECKYEIKKCGVCRLGEKENLSNYVPCLCRMDFPKYRLRGAILYRDKTLADGDECCNFHLVRDKEK